MFAKLCLYPIFLSLFISSFSFSMRDPNINLEYEGCHVPHGEYSTPEEVDSELYKQIIETAPKRVKLLIHGLIRSREENLDLSCLKNVLLHGETGNGKTELARAMGIAAFGKYYYIPAYCGFSLCESCREQLCIEIDQLIQKKEPVAVIFDDILCNSSNLYKYNFFASLLRKCEDEAPFLYIIGTTCNEICDFPDVLIRRFESQQIHISYPKLLIRNQIISYCLHEREHLLTTNDIAELAQRLEGRTCSNIISIINTAAILVPKKNKIITLEEISRAEERNSYKPSKYELMAKELNITTERARELWSDKDLFRDHRTLMQYLYLKFLYTLKKIQFGQDPDVVEFEQTFNTTLAVDEKTDIDQLTTQLNNAKLLLDAEEYMSQKEPKINFCFKNY